MWCSRKYPYSTNGRFFGLNSHPCRNSLLVLVAAVVAAAAVAIVVIVVVSTMQPHNIHMIKLMLQDIIFQGELLGSDDNENMPVKIWYFEDICFKV